ncbi:MAG: biopolymer transporter ExbD [Kiritimatiellaeota bacterium]|nr:biopolymer transporter ExbD [Kiritimatiellota bacterium]
MRMRTRLKVVAGPLDVTPLVDVIFLLLIFFMISSSLVFWPGTRVETRLELPTARTNSMTAADKLIITITRSDLLFFNDNLVHWGDFERQLRQLVHDRKVLSRKRLGDRPDGAGQSRAPVVVLRADRRISYGKIVEVMSLARSLGLDVYLATEPETDGGPAASEQPGTLR